MRDPTVRVQLKKELAAGSQPDWSNLVHASGGWKNVVLANGQSERYRPFHGKSFAEIGKTLGKDPADAAWDIWLGARPARATALYFMMADADIDLAMQQPWVSVGTDASVSDATVDPEAQGRPHPRAYGTSPRILAEYVVARKVLPCPTRSAR